MNEKGQLFFQLNEGFKVFVILWNPSIGTKLFQLSDLSFYAFVITSTVRLII